MEQLPAVDLPTPFLLVTVSGPLLQEVVQTYSYGNGLQQRIRLVSGQDVVEMRHSAGYLEGNRELVARISTDLNTQGFIYHDNSGSPELAQKALNTTGPISSNYHAVVQTSAIVDVSNRRQMTLLTRRTMGVASLSGGQLEYMFMRRQTDTSDSQGPWPLDEQDDITETTWLYLDIATPPVLSNNFARALEFENGLLQLFTDDFLTAPTRNPPVRSFPSSIFVDFFVRYTFANVSGGPEYALRFYHVDADGPQVTLNINDLALGSLQTCTEKTLSLQEDRAANEQHRMTWNAAPSAAKGLLTPPHQPHDERAHQHVSRRSTLLPSSCNSIAVDPLDIRTFVLQ